MRGKRMPQKRMREKRVNGISSPLVIGLGLLASSSAFSAGDYEDWRDRLAVQIASDLPAVAKGFGPENAGCETAATGGDPNPATPKQAPGDAEGFQSYVCEFSPPTVVDEQYAVVDGAAPSPTPGAPTPSPAPSSTALLPKLRLISKKFFTTNGDKSDRSTQVWIGEGNDNPFLGLPAALGAKSKLLVGHDDGKSHDLNLGALFVLDKDTQLRFDLVNQINTKDAVPNDIATGILNYDEILSSLENGNRLPVIQMRQDGTTPDRRVPIQFLEKTGIRASYQKSFRNPSAKPGSDDAFFVKISTGVFYQKTDGKPLVARSTQNWWHNLLSDGGKNDNAPIYEDVAGKGSAPVVEKQGESGQYITALGYAAPTEVEVLKDRGYQADPTLAKLKKLSLELGADVGMRREFLQGRCTLETSAGGLIATNGIGQVFSPNTQLHVNSDVSAKLLTKKDGSDRLNLRVGGTVFYYPKKWVDGDKPFGLEKRAELDYVSRMGKKGNSIVPFITVFHNSGRTEDSYISDVNIRPGQVQDLYTRFGVRMIFSKEKKVGKVRKAESITY